MPAPGEFPLQLEPFRGVRYRPGTDLAAVTAPPYDVLEADTVAELSAAEPHNLVRLLLPQGERTERLETARRTLEAWLADGTLQADEQAALYVYESALDGQVRVRGLVGALRLPPAGARVVLPHEDVMAPVVSDRADLQRSLQAQVEPIWLLYDGGGPASEVVDRTASGPPLEECVTADRTRHRMWAVTDPEDVRAVRADLALRQAVIADGHHRYAAYLQVQAAERDTSGPGPWDLGLALLVDTATHAPQVSAIHRVVRGLAPADLPPSTPVEDWSAALDRLRPGQVVVVDAAGAAGVLELPTGNERRHAFAGTAGEDRPVKWQELDAALLHEVLLPRWGVPEQAVTYHHSASAAVTQAHRDGALAVLLAPVDVGTVLELAGQGVRMPRKSTSFGPKPRGGFVLRSFRW